MIIVVIQIKGQCDYLLTVLQDCPENDDEAIFPQSFEVAVVFAVSAFSAGCRSVGPLHGSLLGAEPPNSMSLNL